MKKSPIHEFLKPTITLSNNCIIKSIHGKSKFKNTSAKDFSNAHEALLSNLMTAVKTNTSSYFEKKVNDLIPENLNIKDSMGNSPLYYACKGEYIKIARILLKFGANIDEKNNQGDTALHIAFKNNNHEVYLNTNIIVNWNITRRRS